MRGDFMSSDYTHKQGIVYKNQFHVIFCPKYRRKVLADEVGCLLYGQGVILVAQSVTYLRKPYRNIVRTKKTSE
jgi:REP element-mobilizing transposase RayT